MLTAAILGTLSGSLPVFLLGGLSVQVAADLGFSSVEFGILVTVFFAGSALTSTNIGFVTERLGARRSMILASVFSGISLGGIGTVATGLISMAIFLSFGSLSNAVVQPAANLLIARGVPQERRGLAFGLKQAAVPLGSMLAGAAVPALGLTVGWRFAFILATLLPLAAALLSPATPAPTPSPTPAPAAASAARTRPESPISALVLLAMSSGSATAAATTLGTFLAVAAVASGLTPAAAGVLLSVGGASSVAARVLIGWRADRVIGGHLRMVQIMMAGGGLGFVLLATADRTGFPVLALTVGTLLGFGAGWGWNGLLTHAVVEHNRLAPAAATGITQTGLYAGGMTGPLLFGFVSDRFGYASGWWLGATLLAIAVLCAALGERRISVAEVDGAKKIL
jgi:predicted MFS family arabinose efflux permease